MPYGYTGALPNQIKNNSGVFSVADITDLTAKGQAGGSLELIEEQTADGTSTTLDFTSLKENKYDVHLLSIHNLQADTNSFTSTRLSNDGGSSFISTSTYQRAYQIGVTNGTFSESRSTGLNYLDLTGGTTSSDAGRSANSYIYFYNLGDSSKYSFTTSQSFGYEDSGNGWGHFGSAVYPVAETHNAIRIFNNSSNNIFATISLYGIAES